MNYVANAYSDGKKKKCMDWMQYLKYLHPNKKNIVKISY